MSFDVLNVKPFDDEEKELIKSIEADEWLPVKNQTKEIATLKEAALATIRKTERINIRISKRDLIGIKAKAIEEGMPYQTLISSIIHKYAFGKKAPF